MKVRNYYDDDEWVGGRWNEREREQINFNWFLNYSFIQALFEKGINPFLWFVDLMNVLILIGYSNLIYWAKQEVGGG